MIKKYVISLSNKAEIQIDEDEVQGVMNAINDGNICMVRQGMFNPSYFVSMTLDEKRYAQYQDDNRYRDNQEKNNRALEPLRDIFEGVLSLSSGNKLIE